MKQRVLSICIHNSARSQMAEAFLNQTCSDSFAAERAGLEPGELNPFAVEVMREAKIDISGKRTRSLSDVLKSETDFDYVITVCDEANAAKCPSFTGSTKRLHWSFPDPAIFTGTREERLAQTREVRDAIRQKIAHWCTAHCTTEAA